MNDIRNKRINRQNKERIEEVRKKERIDKITEQATQDVAMSKLILEREQAQRKQRLREMLIEADSPERSAVSTIESSSTNLQEDLNPFY